MRYSASDFSSFATREGVFFSRDAICRRVIPVASRTARSHPFCGRGEFLVAAKGSNALSICLSRNLLNSGCMLSLRPNCVTYRCTWVNLCELLGVHHWL